MWTKLLDMLSSYDRDDLKDSSTMKSSMRKGHLTVEPSTDVEGGLSQEPSNSDDEDMDDDWRKDSVDDEAWDRNARDDADAANDDSESDDSLDERLSGVMLAGPSQAGELKAVTQFLCKRQNHAQHLRDNVYGARCRQLNLRTNSGVDAILKEAAIGECFCCLVKVSFANLCLGDRGLLGLLSLMKSGHHLAFLNLQGNNIRWHGCKNLAATLEDELIAPKLAVLDLSNNPIDMQAGVHLGQMLARRSSLLLLGLSKCMLPFHRRELLLEQSLENCTKASPSDMFKSFMLASPSHDFRDSELWVRCLPIIESRCTRDQRALCVETVLRYKGESTNEYLDMLGRPSPSIIARNSVNASQPTDASDAESQESGSPKTRAPSNRTGFEVINGFVRGNGNTVGVTPPPGVVKSFGAAAQAWTSKPHGSRRPSMGALELPGITGFDRQASGQSMGGSSCGGGGGFSRQVSPALSNAGGACITSKAPASARAGGGAMGASTGARVTGLNSARASTSSGLSPIKAGAAPRRASGNVDPRSVTPSNLLAPVRVGGLTSARRDGGLEGLRAA
eukprot:TRINITY_DN25459_c0_g1_i1.p1 TRINITY_DN25459_c0_g1~~TRINITY_DN25459_c0_g1_i1.p1  ORF type:complete len:563 (+),score=110.44 TRINITY_DN25459_c0_g1_i1:121-1809(+)